MYLGLPRPSLTHSLTHSLLQISVSFPWYPLYTSPSPLPSASGAFPTVSPALSLPNLEYERLSVLYNLAALHAALGTERRRSDEAGIKAAIAAYQVRGPRSLRGLPHAHLDALAP